MGFGMRGEVWQPQIAELSAHHCVATFDHRGLGDSETSARSWSMIDMAQDALRVADALGWKRFHLVGVSMGGMIAQEVALAAPSRIETLSLIATQPGGATSWLPPREGVRLFIRANRSADRERRLAAMQRLLYPDAFVRAHNAEALTARMRLQFRDAAPPRTRRIQLLAVIRHRAARRLGRIKVPTLIVRPGEDRLINPRHSDRLKALIPHAQLLRFDDAGHGVIYQSATTLNTALLDHFAQRA
jgi:pimeloyl-ACP methyl ester carboxylesterase